MRVIFAEYVRRSGGNQCDTPCSLVILVPEFVLCDMLTMRMISGFCKGSDETHGTV